MHLTTEKPLHIIIIHINKYSVCYILLETKLIPEESAQSSNRSKLHKMLIYFSYFAFYGNISLLITGFCKMMQNIEVHLNDTKCAKSSKLLICTCLIITRAGFLLINQSSSGAGESFSWIKVSSETVSGGSGGNTLT